MAAKVEDLLPQVQGLQVELPFSPDRALADGLIAAYLNEFRTAHRFSTFVLDTSGQHARRRAGAQQLVQAMHYIADAATRLSPGASPSLTNRETAVAACRFPANPMALARLSRCRPAATAARKGVAEQADSDAKQKVLADVRDFAEKACR